MPHIISYFFVSLNNSAYLCSVLPILFIMIIDKLENADRYFGCGKGLKEAFAFLINNELEDLPNCKIKLDGNEVYLTISTLQCKAISDCHLEAHKDYIDIQLLVSGKEKIGWKPQENCDDVFKEYDEQNDVEFYLDEPDTFFTLHEGEFAIFFPEDAHMPCIGEGEEIKKVVVKVRN